MELTQEQRIICESNLDKIKINAFAGTGKTTTLLYFAKNNPQQKILYLCYNKSIQMMSKDLFPKNVDVLTSHSLAYRKLGFNYKERIKSFLSTVKVIDFLNLNKSKNPQLFATFIIKTIENFCVSLDLDIGTNHLPYDNIALSNILQKNTEKDKIKNVIIKKSADLFNEMKNLNSDFPITHDSYLKFFQLSKPKLNYNIIMLDEAQDSVPALINIIDEQKCRKIIVGDTHQSIYGYKGAVNAMNVDNYDNFFLTKSFRFGQNIADFANIILMFKGEDKTIVGSGVTKIENAGVYLNPLDLKLKNNIIIPIKKEQRVVIFRHNASILTYAFNYMKQNKKIYLEGGLRAYNIDQLQDIYRLYIKQKPIDPSLASFKNFEELMESAKSTDNKTVLSFCMLIQKFSTTLPELLTRLINSECLNKKAADIILTNLHKSKGKEYDCVEIYDDFNSSPLSMHFHMSKMNKDINKEGLIDFYKDKKVKIYNIDNTLSENEEANIIYVALTRVKRKLILPRFYFNLLSSIDNVVKLNMSSESLEVLKKNKLVLTDEFKIILDKKILSDRLNLAFNNKENKTSFKI